MKLSYFVTFNYNVLLIAIGFLKRLTNVPDQCALKIRKETYKQHVKIPRDLTSPDLNHCLVASISYRVRSHLYLVVEPFKMSVLPTTRGHYEESNAQKNFRESCSVVLSR